MDEAVMDDVGFEEGAEQELTEEVEQGAGGEEQEQDQPEAEEKVDGRRGSKEFRAALKAWEATPEGKNFAKTARADHFRMQELTALEPGGITALREKYQMLESIGGAEALTTLQERVAGAEATDAALASGDPKVFEQFGPEMDKGLAKLAPAYLDRIEKADPQAYNAALLPHLMRAISGSPLVGDLNKIIDTMGAAHLDAEGKLKAISGLMARIGQWYEHNERKAGEAKTAPVNAEKQELDTQRSAFEKEQQQAHWTNKIQPAVAAHERLKLDEFYKPYEAQLKLGAAAKADLFATFKQRITAAANADVAYQKQMKIYRAQKNPDPAAVTNFVKAATNRLAKSVVDTAVKVRYGHQLSAGRTGGQGTVTKPVTQVGARAATGNGSNAPTIVSVRPPTKDVDYDRTSEQDQFDKIWTLKTGKRVKLARG